MALFQKSVLKKYLNSLDEKKVNAAYQKFTAFFHNDIIIQNIREDKEEQFQYGFLQKLFDEVLDYTINPHPDYNLTTEFKNLRGAKKADGAILKDGKAIAVIELKSTNTKELSKITDQAFGYKNNHPGCAYIITSNFEKVRFYINDAVEYLDFDLFTLKEDEFQLLYLCLQKDHILNDLPQKIKRESSLQEENITKKLYKDYSAFKMALYNDMVAKNPDIAKLTLFKKSQKLIDRFLFILFAEDKGLLPPNSISRIIESFDTLEKADFYKPLYEVFQQYFGYINSGRPARDGKAEIFAFNGGLFAPDEILDNLTISDNILMNHTLFLSAYDFESEVDTNILGHIFEHSLNEIDELSAEIEGQEIDKSKTRRKKDGVFYTPKYITKYIVDNTLGKLCEEKKETLNIKEDEFRPNRTKATKKSLLEDLEAYRTYLLSLTICDPACGSGAFLNQALDFLINEHRYIDELQTKVLGGSIVLSDITNDILEHNIFGVDINEESVEIARLSLWLRTAQKGRTLTDLSKNIKCGNSLIDDPEVAGDKAFNWEREFTEVFENGGFDVIMGNPPYVRSRGLFNDSEKEFYYSQFESISYQPDLYKLFIEKSIKLIIEGGYLSFITPSVFMVNDYDENLRKYILNNVSIFSIANTDEDVFRDASVKTVVFVFKKMKLAEQLIRFFSIINGEFHFCKTIPQNTFFIPPFIINEKLELESIQIINKLNKLKKIKEDFEVKNGIKVRKNLLYKEKKTDDYKPFLLGKNLGKFIFEFENVFIHYLNENEKLYSNQAFRSSDIFEQKKLIVRQILGHRIITCFDEDMFYTDQTTYVINASNDENKLKKLLCILNSKLLFFYFQNTLSDNKVTFPKVKRSQLLELPIPNRNDSNLVSMADQMIELSHNLNRSNSKFIRLISRKFKVEKLSKKLKNWSTLSFSNFLNELKKKKVQLSLVEETEWEDYFETEKAKAQGLKAAIEKTDKEIDQMVYELFGLTEEEIAIVEG